MEMIDKVGGFPIMSEPDELTDTFKMLYEAAVRLRNGGMSDHQAVKTALSVYHNLQEVLGEDNSNG